MCLIPAGGLPMLLFSGTQPFLIGKVPVLEGIAVVLKAAEMAVALHRLTGIPASRAGSLRQGSGRRHRGFSRADGGDLKRGS